jgi:site-specific DNA-methyltransferase (adenine-specific)
MIPYFKTDRGKLYYGDCLEVMASLEEKSIHSLITDPPYGLKFMGKEWDYDVPKIEIWSECLRVLKPGAHAFIFAGSRTQHRMAVNVEDAGFILKDCFMWLYGSGFPKSTDISKQIDKHGGAGHLSIEFAKQLRQSRKSRNISKSDADKMFCNSTTNYSWFEGRKAGQRLPSEKEAHLIMEAWPELKPILEKVAEAEREVIGKDKNWGKEGNVPLTGYKNFNITAPATPEAELWDGWGTHAKPAYEPILLAMKKNEGTYAQNALKHGVAGLNIDGGRIPIKSDDWKGKGGGGIHTGLVGQEINNQVDIGTDKRQPIDHTKGRFPANVILDEEAAKLLDQQSGILKTSGTVRNNKLITRKPSQGNCYSKISYTKQMGYNDDFQGASRFFYTAKASASERDGSTHPTMKPLKLMQYLCTLLKTPTGGVVLDPFGGSGTTALACHAVGRPWILIEREEKYCEIAARRIEAAASQKSFEDYYTEQ